jgi:acetolactate synthase-1/2/3 large subunit
MRNSDVIIQTLSERGVNYVFGISAGTVSSIFDAINDYDIEPIITKNEAGAAYAASRYAAITNKLAVCVFAGGVGINNAINGIAEAMRSKVPLLVISGYVHRWQIGKGAIQELDTENILKPITKYSKTILDENKLKGELVKAIDLAMTPPYGPVHISIPIDIQISEAKFIGNEADSFVEGYYEGSKSEAAVTLDEDKIIECNEYDLEQLELATKLIDNEEYGLIMVGRGCSGLGDEVKAISRHLNWPVITTPQAKGVVSCDFELNLGNYGFSSTDQALNFVDTGSYSCLLVLGSSLGESATRNYNDILVKGKKIIQIDWDKKELSKIFKADINACYDLRMAIPYLTEKTDKKKIYFKKPEKLNSDYVKDHTGLSFRLFLENIVDIVPKDTYFISDIGEYMNFLFKYLPVKEGMDFDISLNYGAMGSGVCGALGAHLALHKKRQVAVFVGDGSFFMNGTEILTAKHYNMPIIYFVINNAMLGYVEHGHKYLYGRSLKNGFVQDRISISDMGKALGIKSIQITDLDQLEDVKSFLGQLSGPGIVELITDGTEKVAVADRFKALNNSSKVG